MTGTFGYTLEDVDVRGDGTLLAAAEVEFTYDAWPFRKGDYYTPDEPSGAEITGHRVLSGWLNDGGLTMQGPLLDAAVARMVEAMHRELCDAALEDAAERSERVDWN
jgi:hypothetical protein